jgi:galactokinase
MARFEQETLSFYPVLNSPFSILNCLLSLQFLSLLLTIPSFPLAAIRPVSSPRETIEQQAVSSFRRHFECPPSVVASAPGRINLIGEHTDYNDGYVLPAAIDRTTAVALGHRADDKLVMRSASFTEEASFRVARLYPSERRTWTDYVIGVASLLQDRCGTLKGANLLVHGDVPRGAGLSSSASLELAVAFGLIRLNGFSVPSLDIINICQRAEHEFAGVRCGIMDQFIACLGKRDHALLLDCRSQSYEHIPLPPGMGLLICDTGVRRALGNSEYNARRQQCEEGVRILSTRIAGVKALRDVSMDQLHEFSQLLSPLVLRRCIHVVTENARTLRSAEALRRNDLGEFGKLMYDSHASLRADYEVSCAELDAVVDICAVCEGVYGARMTGAGFGGCAVCALTVESIPRVTECLGAGYTRRFKRVPSVYACTIEDGAASRCL